MVGDNSRMFFNFQIRSWIKLFLTLGNKRKGYANKNVTPYMHAAAYHIQAVFDRLKNLKQFSGQGRDHLVKSNETKDPLFVI